MRCAHLTVGDGVWRSVVSTEVRECVQLRGTVEHLGVVLQRCSCDSVEQEVRAETGHAG